MKRVVKHGKMVNQSTGILSMPDKVDITFFPTTRNYRKNESILKIRNAVVTDFTVEYSAGTQNPTFFKDTGAPLSVTLNVTVKETEIYITRSGYTGEDGFEISIKNEKVEKFVELLIESGSKLIGLGARDTLRLEAGLCLYGNDIDQKTSPIEANLKWAISKSRIEDNYPGSSIIKNQIEKGVKKLRVGIKPETRVIARGDTKIFNGESKEIGKITSGTFGPSVDCSIAMGYVDNIYSSLNTKIFLEIRGKKIPASICNLPFYKKNYAKGGTNV